MNIHLFLMKKTWLLCSSNLSGLNIYPFLGKIRIKSKAPFKAIPIVATYDKIEISIAKNIFIISPFFVVQYYNKKILKFQRL